MQSYFLQMNSYVHTVYINHNLCQPSHGNAQISNLYDMFVIKRTIYRLTKGIYLKYAIHPKTIKI